MIPTPVFCLLGASTGFMSLCLYVVYIKNVFNQRLILPNTVQTCLISICWGEYKAGPAELSSVGTLILACKAKCAHKVL